ncbi:MAG: Uma2 family endonuclease [Chloroflexota bacterium]
MVARIESPASLESGDHLSQAEFHRRYSARPDIRKAELVEGVVYLASPVRVDRHGEPHGFVIGWLAQYVAGARDAHLADNATVILDDRNEVQPDAFLWRRAPGGPRLTADGYLEGAPQLVVEIAASSVAYDLHEKKEAYRRNGVREYVVWRVLDGAIDWFRLTDGQYAPVSPDADGVIESDQFPGLRLHVASMLAGDLASVLGHNRQG